VQGARNRCRACGSRDVGQVGVAPHQRGHPSYRLNAERPTSAAFANGKALRPATGAPPPDAATTARDRAQREDRGNEQHGSAEPQQDPTTYHDRVVAFLAPVHAASVHHRVPTPDPDTAEESRIRQSNHKDLRSVARMDVICEAVTKLLEPDQQHLRLSAETRADAFTALPDGLSQLWRRPALGAVEPRRRQERRAPGRRHPTGLTNSTNGIDESVVKLPPMYVRRMNSPPLAFSLVAAGFEW
jgi:hypothetical protein